MILSEPEKTLWPIKVIALTKHLFIVLYKIDNYFFKIVKLQSVSPCVIVTTILILYIIKYLKGKIFVFLNFFEQNFLHFHFVLGPTNYVPSPWSDKNITRKAKLQTNILQ